MENRTKNLRIDNEIKKILEKKVSGVPGTAADQLIKAVLNEISKNQ